MFLDAVHQRTTATYTFVTILLLLSIAGAGNLSLSADNRAFYGPSYEPYLDLLEFEDRFEFNSRVLFVVSSEHPFTESQQFRDAVQWVSDRASQLEKAVRVDSLLNYPKLTSSDDDDVAVIPLAEFVCPDQCIVGRGDALRSVEVVNRLIDGEQKNVGVIVTVDIDVEDVEEIGSTDAHVKRIVQEFLGLYPGFQIHYTGAVPMMQAFVEAAERDLTGVLLLCFVVIYALLYLFLGTHAGAAMVFVVGVFSILTTMGVAGWWGLRLNTATAITPLVVFTLVVAAEMHLVLHVIRRREQSNEDLAVSIRAAVSDQIGPLTVAAITSALGLLSLLFVESPPIRELGVLSAVGVAVGWFYTLFLVPVVLKHVGVTESRVLFAVQRSLNKYARWLEHGRSTFSATLVGFVLGASGVFMIVVDDDFIRYFDDEMEFRENAEYTTEKLFGPYHIEAIVDSGSVDGVFDPGFLSLVGSLTSFLREQPEVRNAASLADVLSRIGEVLDPDVAFSDIGADTAAQYFLAYELGLQYGQSTTDVVDSDRRHARVSILLSDLSSQQTNRLKSRIESWFSVNAGGRGHLLVTGENVPVAGLSEVNIVQLAYGVVLSLLATALLLSVYFRNWKIGIVGLMAMIGPVLCGFGLWGWLSGTIGLATTMIIAATIGVVIDDAVHLIFRQFYGLKHLELDALEAAAYSVHRVGTAVVVTTTTLVSGFLLLTFSGYELNSSFGLSASLIFLLALAFDLLALPKMLVWATS